MVRCSDIDVGNEINYIANLRRRSVSYFHARCAVVNLSPHGLRVEDVEEELIRPRSSRLLGHEAETLIVQELV